MSTNKSRDPFRNLTKREKAALYRKGATSAAKVNALGKVLDAQDAQAAEESLPPTCHTSPDTKPAHTPGPVGLYRGPYRAACGCVWSGNGTEAQPFAVGRCPLHAAAPDLLAFAVRFATGNAGTSLDCASLREEARAAIRRATGANE